MNYEYKLSNKFMNLPTDMESGQNEEVKDEVSLGHLLDPPLKFQCGSASST